MIFQQVIETSILNNFFQYIFLKSEDGLDSDII